MIKINRNTELSKNLDKIEEKYKTIKIKEVNDEMYGIFTTTDALNALVDLSQESETRA